MLISIKPHFSLLLVTILPLFSFAHGDSSKVLVRVDEPFKTSVSNYDARGPKKSISVSVYSISGHSIDTNSSYLLKTIERNYDERGNCIYEKTIDFDSGKAVLTQITKKERKFYEAVSFDKDSSYFKKEKWERINKKYSFRHTSYAPLETDTTDVEDENYTSRHRGRLVAMKRTIDRHDEREATITRYDRRHRPTEQNYYTYGKQWLKKTWEYDKNQILLADTTVYLENGKATMQNIVRYDRNGNIVEQLNNVFRYNSSSTRQTFKYDSNNHQTEWNQYLADGSLQMKEKSLYDNRGNLVKEIVMTNVEKFNFERTYSYNKYDLITAESGTNADSTYHYERTNDWEQTDPYGNWLKVTEYLNGLPQRITVRKIEYYRSPN